MAVGCQPSAVSRFLWELQYLLMPQTSFYRKPKRRGPHSEQRMGRSRKPKIMIVAGEPSGDLHASQVAHQLKALCPDITLFGMGGDRMEKASVKLDFHIRDSAVMGFADVITVLPMFLRKQAYLKRHIREERPDALLLVDFAEFNMPLAKVCSETGCSGCLLHPPEKRGRGVQAGRRSWRSGQTLSQQSSLLRRNFTETRARTPSLLDIPSSILLKPPSVTQAAREHLNLCGTEGPVIGLMPGSRRSEIQHIFPVMLEAAANIAKVYPNAQWVLPLAPGIPRELIAKVPAGAKSVRD